MIKARRFYRKADGERVMPGDEVTVNGAGATIIRYVPPEMNELHPDGRVYVRMTSDSVAFGVHPNEIGLKWR